MGCVNSNASGPSAASTPSNGSPAKNSSPTRSPESTPEKKRFSMGSSSSTSASPPFQARGIASNPGNLGLVYDVEERKIGEGRFGHVNKGRHKEKQIDVAIKAVPIKKMEDVDAISQEIDMMNKMNHGTIVKLHESFQDNSFIYLVVDFCAGGTLLERVIGMGRFKEPHAAKVMLQILPALQYLHEERICHRDVKPENFMFVDWDIIQQGLTGKLPSIRMIDFGTATVVGRGEFLDTMVGTPSYVAPEVLQGKYNHTCDLWSTGITLFVVLSGILPFKGNTDDEVLQQARLGNIPLNTPDWSDVSEDAKDLVKELCQMRASDRPSAEDALDHKWLLSLRDTTDSC